MLKFNRQKRILDILKTNGNVSIKELINDTETSRFTIQRDLVELEKEKLLTRIRGGAILPDQIKKTDLYDNHEQDHGAAHKPLARNIRKTQNIELKKKLCQKAISFVKENETIFIDCSTTCSYIPHFLPNIPMNIVTSSIETFTSLLNIKNANPVLTGGEYNPETQNLIGPVTSETIDRFSFSLCFLSADAIDFQKGSLDRDIRDSAVKKSAIKNAAKVILLIDYTKFKKTKGFLTCKTDDIDIIVTNTNKKHQIPKSFQGKILEVL